ncbi:MAG: hypothetical protein KKF00_08030 [Proteobacteria bacterium]|nr:hypothetical protein [Pseudomonadota bacterium]
MKKNGSIFKYPIPTLIAMGIFMVSCQGLQVNIPVEVQPVKREDAALLVLVENKSSRQIKITYPISTGMLKQNQHTVFRLPKPGNHKVVITAYSEDPDYRDVYRPVATVELPVFLNGYDIVKARGNFVGYYLEVTEGMLLPNR